MGLELVTIDQWNEALSAGQAKWEATGFLPDIFRSPWLPLYDYFGYFQKDLPPTDDEIEEALPAHDLSDRVQRALVASIIGAMIETAEQSADPSDSAMLCALLKRYLAASYVAPDTLADLRWEIRAGLAARDLRRVSSSCDLWLGFDPRAEILEIAVDSAFAAISNLEVFRGALDPEWHWPLLSDVGTRSDEEQRVAHGTMFVWATTVHPIDPLYPPPLEPSILRNKMWTQCSQAQGVDSWTGLPSEQDRQDRKELLRVCVSLTQTLGLERVNRFQHLAALSAWCDLALGAQETRTDMVGQAAAKYAQISGAGWAAVDCYQHARMFAEAERETRRCITVSPDATAYRRLAEVLYKQERIPDAIAAFETYVRLKGDEQDDGWQDSLTLRLGLESQQGRQLLLQAAAERASWAPMGHKLAEWTHPWFSLLCPESKKKWWTGLWVVSSPDARANLDAQSVLEEAAAAFGEAVAMELRGSVFRAFLRDNPSAPQVTPLPDGWAKIRQDKATLGQMLFCLRQVKERSPASGTLAEWLRQHKPELLNYLGSPRTDLTRLTRLRGEAQHNTVTQAEARLVFEDAAGLLQHIVSS